jgi:hypothetical protein
VQARQLSTPAAALSAVKTMQKQALIAGRPGYDLGDGSPSRQAGLYVRTESSIVVALAGSGCRCAPASHSVVAAAAVAINRGRAVGGRTGPGALWPAG